MGYFADLIIELFNEQNLQDSEGTLESSWNIEKGLVCRYKNESVYLQLDCFCKNWRNELIVQFQEVYYKEHGIFLADSLIEIVKLQVRGNLEECYY
jgi:hypothetical protein